MKSSVPHSLPFALWSVLVASLLIAGGAACAQEMPLVQTNLSTLSWDKPISNLYYLNSGQVEEIKAYPGGFSIPVPYSGPATIAFYQDKAALHLPVEERPPPSVVANLTNISDEMLLVFIPAEAGTYRILTWDASTDNFTARSYRVLNLTGQPVVLALGDKPELYRLEPDKLMIIRQPGNHDNQQTVKVQLAQNNGEEMRLVYRSMWTVSSNRRNTVFIIPSEDSRGGVQVKKFIERNL